MNENKHRLLRVIAKLADYLLGGIFVILFTMITVLVITLIVFFTGVELIDPSLSQAEVAQRMVDSVPFTAAMLVTVHVGYFIYFGLFGKRTYGSLGKYMVNLQLTRKDNQALVPWQLYLREPIVISNLISGIIRLITLALGFGTTLGGTAAIVVSIYYLSSLITGRDIWNANYKLN